MKSFEVNSSRFVFTRDNGRDAGVGKEVSNEEDEHRPSGDDNSAAGDAKAGEQIEEP